MPGRVLDPVRILVGSTSNFGAPVAHFGQLTGSFLSIDPRFPDTLTIPPDFAAAGDQASALFGRVQMYSTQSPAFRNGVNNRSAVTAEIYGREQPARSLDQQRLRAAKSPLDITAKSVEHFEAILEVGGSCNRHGAKLLNRRTRNQL